MSVFAAEPVMLLHGVAVGHAGDVVAHGAVQARLARLPARLLADFLRVLQIKTEQVPQKLLRPDVRLVHHAVVIQIFVKIAAEFDIQLAALRAVSHERLCAAPHVIGGLHAGIVG